MALQQEGRLRREKSFCVHAHFYQPMRGNPVNGEIGREPGANPFRNWNERITQECYRPNAELGNLKAISFNFGETLLSWVCRHQPDVYQMILDADAYNVATYGVGNALAMPIHHTILPLARRRDKRTQIAWAKAAFVRRFGREPEGLWLPETAIDLETLEVTHELGFQFTVLSGGQINSGVDEDRDGSGPYWVALPGGGQIATFVRHEKLSSDLAFGISNLGGAGRWARYVLSPHRKHAGPLTLVAVDGETFGHHHQGEYQFLRWLTSYEAKAVGYEVTTLSRYFQGHPPTRYVEVKERTAWSCHHGVLRWVTGCGCTPGYSGWKGALRRALDRLCCEIDALYEREITALGVDPWALRDGYINVVLCQESGPDYLERMGLALEGDRQEDVLDMLRAQYQAQLMYSSCAFFFEDFARPEPRYAISNAAYAIQLMRRATGVDLSDAFRYDLTVVVSSANGHLNGTQVYDEVAQQLELPGALEPA